MSHFNLSNIKNVLIVGAGHGIGFALAEELVSRLGDCHIFSTYRNPNDAQPLLDLGKNNSSNLTNNMIISKYKLMQAKIKSSGSSRFKILDVSYKIYPHAIIAPKTAIAVFKNWSSGNQIT